MLYSGILLLAAGLTAEPIDTTMGNFEGTWKNSNAESGKVTAKIVALGEDQYQATFTSQDGDKEHVMRLPIYGKREDGALKHSGKVNLPNDEGVLEWSLISKEGKLTGEYKTGDDSGSFELTRVTKTPANVGTKPPEGAIVLFDGTSLDNFVGRDGKPVTWKLIDGAMEVARAEGGKGHGGDIISKQKFTDHKLHVEFRTPFMPTARGQARGNSGVYIQGRYEVQVLDSYGEPPRDNEAGGIYKAAAPKVNAALPPGEWQAYDITFHAPRFENGKMVKPARVSVVYNGEQIHTDSEVSNITPSGVEGKQDQPGPLLLQDHGNPVQYRNIWAVPIND